MILGFKRKKKVVEEKEDFLKKEKVKDFDKLPETEKLILKGVVYGFKATLDNTAPIPFDIYLVTEEKLMEFKNDFYTKDKEEHSRAYKEWLAYFGLEYELHRYVVRKMVRGIYEYTGGRLDYRNSRMRNEVSYEHKATIAKKLKKDKCKIV